MPAPPRGGPMQTIETRVRCQTIARMTSMPHVRRVNPAGGDFEGFGRCMLATTVLVTTPCQSAPSPLQPLQPSRAFRLTPDPT